MTTLKRVSTGQAGTPIYMAPEQIQGNPCFASDQYALAVVVYEWICGARPFSGESLALMYQHVHTQPPSLRVRLSTISPGIEQVVLKALAKDPQQRYATILDFAKALEENVQRDVGLTFLPSLPPASVSPPLIAAAPVQPAVFKPGSESAIRARPWPAPAKSLSLAQQRHGPAPHWIVLLLGLACILIAGSIAFANVLVRTNAQVKVTDSANTYNAAAVHGIMDGFDAQHTRVNPYEKIITPATVPLLQEAWKAPTRGAIGSAATVANNEVYISSCSGQMFALRAKTSARVWSSHIGSCDFGNAPALANSDVYMGAPDDNLYAYNASTGKILWRAPTRGRIGSSPTLANRVIYIGSDDHNLYAFDASTGKWLWQYPTGNDIRSSPAVANGIVYVGSDDGKLYAIDAAHGTLRWTGTTGGGIDSSPAVYKGVVSVGSKGGKLYAFYAANGRLLWTATTEGGISSSPTVADGVLFIGSNDDSLYAYAADGCGKLSCKELWSYPTEGSVVSSPVVANGYVYVGSDDGYLYAFDTGKV